MGIILNVERSINIKECEEIIITYCPSIIRYDEEDKLKKGKRDEWLKKQIEELIIKVVKDREQ
jgi:hypothetical protein